MTLSTAFLKQTFECKKYRLFKGLRKGGPSSNPNFPLCFYSFSGFNSLNFACLHRGVRVTLAQHKEPTVLKSSSDNDSLVVVEVIKHGVEI